MTRRSRASLFLSTALGKDSSIVMIAASAAFVAISFFYIYSLASYFKILVWSLQDRVSYYTYFETYVIDRTADHLIIALTTALWLALSLKHKVRFVVATIYGITALILASFNLVALLDAFAILSVPLISILLVINTLLSNKFLISDRNLVITYFAIIGIGISVLSLLISIQPIYFDEELIPLRSIAYEIFLISTSLSPILLALLIFCLPLKVIADESIASIHRFKLFINSMTLQKSLTRLPTKIFLISLFMILSSTMVMIPHQSAINKDNQDVGVDTHYYVEEIALLANSTSLGDLFNQAFVTIQNGDRPFTLLFFLMIAKIMPSDNVAYVFDNVPIILGPSLVLVFYFLTRELTSNDTASLLSAFLTAISFHTLVGIYAGSYANWLALIVAYLSIVFVLRSLKEIGTLNVLLFIVLINTALFTHIYTWSILALVIGIFLLAMLKIKFYERRNVIIALIALSSSVFVDVLRTFLTGAYSGIGYDISPPFGSIVQLGPEQFSARWSTLMDTTLSYLGSLFGNSIIYALGLYWLIRSKLRDISTIFMVTFLSIGIIPLFLGNWIVQARVFYDIPFQIPAAVALTYLFQRRNGTLILVAVSIWLVSLAIRAVSNFYFIPPPT